MGRGGKRAGAGRKPDAVQKVRVSTSVPIKYRDEIKEKFRKIVKAYTERCEKEL